MTLRITLGMFSLAGAVLCSGCGFSKPPPFDPKRIERMQVEPARQDPPEELPQVSSALDPTTRPAAAVTRPYGRQLPMTLQEAIHRTVINSLDVRVAGYQPAIDEARILEAEARFDPLVFAEGQVQRSYPQNIGGGNPNPTELLTQSLEAGFRQNMTTGGQIEFKYQVQRTGERPRPVPPFTPATFYQNDLTLSLTQPILRDFGAAANLARITIARNDYRISLYEFRNTLEEQLQRVEETYWRLALTQRDILIQEELLEATRRMHDLLVNRMEAGADVSNVQVSQARGTLESRNVDLIRQRYRLGELSTQLKGLMQDPQLPIASNLLIVATDEPIEDPINYDLADQIEAGLQNRLELAQQSLRVDSASTVVRAAENNVLPQLNATAQVGLQGLGTNFNEAVESQGNTDFITYGLGFQFEVPIGNRQARAIYQRTLLQRQQAIDQWQLTAWTVANEVWTAWNNVRQTYMVFIASRRATEAAKDALEAIEVRERANEPLTPTFVELKLSRQSAYAEAARQEIEALIAYNVSLETLEKAKGTLLRYNNVVMKEEKGPMFMKVSAIPEKKEKKVSEKKDKKKKK